MTQRPARAGGKSAKKFGRWLAELRKDEPLTAVTARMRQVRAGISESTLNRYENEGRVPDLLALYGLAYAYDVPFVTMIAKLCEELTDGRCREVFKQPGMRSALTEAHQYEQTRADLEKSSLQIAAAFTPEVERVAQSLIKAHIDGIEAVLAAARKAFAG